MTTSTNPSEQRPCVSCGEIDYHDLVCRKVSGRNRSLGIKVAVKDSDRIPAGPSGSEIDNSRVHLTHCNLGEYIGSCKYASDDCPALRPDAPPCERGQAPPECERRPWCLTHGRFWRACEQDNAKRLPTPALEPVEGEAPERVFLKACHPDSPNRNCSWSVSKDRESSVEYVRADLHQPSRLTASELEITILKNVVDVIENEKVEANNADKSEIGVESDRAYNQALDDAITAILGLPVTAYTPGLTDAEKAWIAEIEVRYRRGLSTADIRRLIELTRKG